MTAEGGGDRDDGTRERCRRGLRWMLGAGIGAALGLVLSGTLPTLGAWPRVTSAQEKKSGRPNPMLKENVQRGMALFGGNCSMCHGAEARGGIGPTLIDSPLVRHDTDGSQVAGVIHNGRLDKGMPAFPNFSEAQVSDIVAFLHASIEINDRRDSGAPARGVTLEQFMTGDAAAGKQFFEGAGGCAKCHSMSGDLSGVAKKYTPLPLLGRFLYPTVEQRTGTVRTATGEKVKGKIVHLDAFLVAMVDEGGAYRSWPLGEGVTVVVDDPLKAHRELLERYQDKEIHDVFAYLQTAQ